MLSLKSIFSSSEYLDEGFDRPRWCADNNHGNGSHYTTLRRTEGKKEILLHHPQNSDPSSIQTLVSVSQLYPSGSTTPLLIDDYVLSNDQTKVLLFTNSQKVWRLNTKGCYWIISLQDSSPPYQLGATLPNPKILMFATFSPCNSRVAYVYENNIYCEDISSHQITQLTFDGNENIINGTFDWVYEEEFHLRNGYR
jgi:dipeptidyl-peptidase 4